MSKIFKRKKPHKRLCRAISETFLEAPPRFELGDQSFADSCLTTWLWRRI